MPRRKKTLPRPRMSFDWFTGCTDETEKEARLLEIMQARNGLEVLYELLKRRKEKLDRPTRDEYDTPAWQYRLAHDNGRLEEDNYLLSLLDPLFKGDPND